MWDLSLERDEEEEAEFKAQTEDKVNAPEDLPPQLLFVHQVSSKKFIVLVYNVISNSARLTCFLAVSGSERLEGASLACSDPRNDHLHSRRWI